MMSLLRTHLRAGSARSLRSSMAASAGGFLSTRAGSLAASPSSVGDARLPSDLGSAPRRDVLLLDASRRVLSAQGDE